jgi:hypothetical protein
MSENIFLNKTEMVSFYWVDVKIGRGVGDFLYTLHFGDLIDSGWQPDPTLLDRPGESIVCTCLIIVLTFFGSFRIANNAILLFQAILCGEPVRD